MSVTFLLAIVGICFLAVCLFSAGLGRTAANADDSLDEYFKVSARNQGPAVPRAAGGVDGYSDAGSRTGVRRPWRSAGADVGSAPAPNYDNGPAATPIPARGRPEEV